MLSITDYNKAQDVIKGYLKDNKKEMFNGGGLDDSTYWYPLHKKKVWKAYKKKVKQMLNGLVPVRDDMKLELMSRCINMDKRCAFLKDIWEIISPEDAYFYVTRYGYDSSVEVEEYIDMLRELKAAGVVRGVRSDVKYVYQIRNKKIIRRDMELYWCRDWLASLKDRTLFSIWESVSDLQLLRVEIDDDMILMESKMEGYVLDTNKLKDHKVESIMLYEAGNELWQDYKR